ncbi:hypothetical protein J2Y69_002018 [Microbacterium resistens]|uniref:Integral membrane protein n=1 Tax=Microbacterium resistens TaxID=156977 RepID=A0ABU1SCS8_9MICO|nr:hypothetical protein [Microbacterium resistens]MDR6867415.1 hypothetical protein [Microbacterium resistens]
MMDAVQARFARLLRWYPKSWRMHSGEVLLSAMLDEAARQGRDRPTLAEQWLAGIYGLGARLNARLASVCAVAALLMVALASIGLSAPALADGSVRWAVLTVSTGVCPALVAIGAVALARHRGWLSEPRALIVLILALPSLMLTALAVVSWSVGFDAVDRDSLEAWFAGAWAVFVPAGWLAGAASVSVLFSAFLARSRLPATMAISLSVVAGTVAAPIIGVSLLTPYSTAAASVGLAVLSLRPLRSQIVSTPTPIRASARGGAPRPWRSPRALPWLAAAGSACGVVYAFTGTHWSAGATGATIAMGQGITLSLVSSLPLLAGVGIVLTARSRKPPTHTWGPLLLLSLSFLSVALGYVSAPTWDQMASGFAVGSALGGAAIAWWAATHLRGRPAARIPIAAAIGIGFGALQGMFLAPLWSFALPLVAAAFAIWMPRDGGSRTRVVTQGGGAGYGTVPQA